MVRVYVSVAASALALANVCCNNAAPPEVKGNVPGGGPDVKILAEPTRVVVEVEAGTIDPPFEVKPDSGASGGTCVVLAEKWETDAELHPGYRANVLYLGGDVVTMSNIPTIGQQWQWYLIDREPPYD